MMPAPLSRSLYPALDPASAGEYPPVGYGSVDGVPAPCIVSGAAMRLASGIGAAETSLEVDDAPALPSPPFTVQLAGERMLVASVTGNTLGGLTRGADGTTASAHPAGRRVFELRPEYVYLISPEPIAAIRGVVVDGVAQQSGFSAYTGRPGDEHPDWPGMAVVAFEAQLSASAQRNISAASTCSVDATMLEASHRELMASGGAAPVLISGKRARPAWVAFTGSGPLTSQAYCASVHNTGASDAVVRALVKVSATDEVLATECVLVQASAAVAVGLSHDGGPWETCFMLFAGAGASTLEISGIKKTVTAVNPAEGDKSSSYLPAPSMLSYRGLGIERTATLKPKGKRLAWAAYSADSFGPVLWQTHRAAVANTGATDSVVRLIASAPTGECAAMADFTVRAGDATTLELTHPGGGWDTMSRVAVQSGMLRVDALSKEVRYVTGTDGPSAGYSSTARAVIGDEVTVDADWCCDETGAVIERPDKIMRHFLVERMGFADTDIDSASFAAADAAYAGYVSGGYRFGFVINDKVTPSGFVRSLAAQCRSVLRYARGLWRLDAVPSAAPAPVRTISAGELAGEGAMFRFKRVPLEDMGNSLRAYYGAVYSKGGGWSSIASVNDAGSIERLGLITREFRFPAIRDKSTAEDVLGLMLLERAASLLIVNFTVFYEHFDLNVGDTISIDNELYNGALFFIERIERPDSFRAKITARQWWG